MNLNRIGRRGNFSVQRAQELMAELKIAEEVYKKQLIQFSEDLDILNNNSLRLQVIHTTITNPELVAKVLNKPVTRNNVLEFVNDLLGLTSLQEFYNEIGEQGFFDINELTKLAGQKNKDGNFDVDNEILQDILDLAEECIECEQKEVLQEIKEVLLDAELRPDKTLDGTPVYKDIEKAELYGQLFYDCMGSHVHDIDGEVYYMGCKSHQEVLKRRNAFD